MGLSALEQRGLRAGRRAQGAASLGRHRKEITELYRRMELEEVTKHMKNLHGVKATRRQYISMLSKWQVRKYKVGQIGKRISQTPQSSHDSLCGEIAGGKVDSREDSPQDEMGTCSEEETAEAPRTIEATGEGQWPCPFRLRNPVRFNIRDHEQCAFHTYPTISALKRHISVRHTRTQESALHQCLRCGDRFVTPQELQDHVVLPRDQICSPAEVVNPALDPENGISSEVRGKLMDRSAKGKVSTWKEIWKLLFPRDRVPHPRFEPPREIDEVRDQMAIILHSVLASRGMVLKMCEVDGIVDVLCTRLKDQDGIEALRPINKSEELSDSILTPSCTVTELYPGIFQQLPAVPYEADQLLYELHTRDSDLAAYYPSCDEVHQMSPNILSFENWVDSEAYTRISSSVGNVSEPAQRTTLKAEMLPQS